MSKTDPLVEAFERGEVNPAAFHHREHLYVAWCYLRELSVEDALARYVRHLKALTVKLGVPQKFHATITWAWLVALADAMERAPGSAFDALLEANPSLLDARGGLSRWYGAAELDSARARARFVLPERP